MKALHTHGILSLGSGTLSAVPGYQHRSSTSDYDLNVFLDCGMLPEGLFIDDDIYAFPVKDGDAPVNNVSFETLRMDIIACLNAGQRVAVSCFGGHGRTGTLLTIIYGHFHPMDKDPIKTVRESVCLQEVESYAQVEFIHEYLKLDIPPHYAAMKKSKIDWVKWNEDDSTKWPKVIGSKSQFDYPAARVKTMKDGLFYVKDYGEVIPVVNVITLDKQEGAIVRWVCLTCSGVMHVSKIHPWFVACTCGEERIMPIDLETPTITGFDHTKHDWFKDAPLPLVGA